MADPPQSWRTYIDAKHAKLQQQYAPASPNDETQSRNIFNNVKAFVSNSISLDKATEEGELTYDHREICRILKKGGGTLHHSVEASTTHFGMFSVD